LTIDNGQLRVAGFSRTIPKPRGAVPWSIPHGNNFEALKKNKLLEFDMAWAGLVQDLHQRGMMDDTLVLVWGEFGRTPRVNKDAGRDHWPGAMSVVFARGGLKMGQAIGETDAKAEYPKDRPISPEDVLSTMYHVLGVDQNVEYENEAQRPIKVLNTKVGDVKMTNVARGGGLTWSTVNTPGNSRMQDSIMLSVREPAPFSLHAEPVAKEVVAGEKLEINVKLTRTVDWTDEVQLAGIDMPQICTMALVNIDKGKQEAKVELAVAANAKSGIYTFTVNGSGQMARNYPLERDAKKMGQDPAWDFAEQPANDRNIAAVKK